MVRNSPASVGDARAMGLIPGSGRSLGVEKWEHTPLFLPGKFHEQRRPAGYSPWGHEELDTTEHVSVHTCTHTHTHTHIKLYV